MPHSDWRVSGWIYGMRFADSQNRRAFRLLRFSHSLLASVQRLQYLAARMRCCSGRCHFNRRIAYSGSTRHIHRLPGEARSPFLIIWIGVHSSRALSRWPDIPLLVPKPFRWFGMDMRNRFTGSLHLATYSRFSGLPHLWVVPSWTRTIARAQTTLS